MTLNRAVRAAIIRNKEILIMKKWKEPWELPGGWPGGCITDVDYLRTTLPKWFRGIQITDDFTYLDCFRSKNSKCEIYVAGIVGNIRGMSMENWQHQWIEYDERKKYDFKEFTLDILDRLNKYRRI